MKPMLDFTKPMTKCDRCGKLICLAPESARHEDSRPFRLAKVPKGVCANCVVTQFLYNTYPINMQIDEAGPKLLLNPSIREAFLQCGLLAHCDLNIDEVEWAQVVANWDLPVKIQKSGMNPYRMGESPHAQARKQGLPRPAMDYMPAQQEQNVFADCGKEQYCPKCGQPTSPGPSDGRIFDAHATDCSVCNFQSNAIWLREIPSVRVQ